MRLLFAFVCLCLVLVFLFGFYKGICTLALVLLATFITDSSPKLCLLRQFIIFLQMLLCIPLFYSKDLDGSLVSFFLFCGMFTALARRQKSYQTSFFASHNKTVLDENDFLDGSQKDWAWLASSDFYFLCLKLLIGWLFIAIMSLLYVKFFDKGIILPDGTRLKAFAYIGIGLAIVGSFAQKLLVTLNNIVQLFAKDKKVETWLKEKAIEMEKQGTIEQGAFESIEERDVMMLEAAKRAFTNCIDSDTRIAIHLFFKLSAFFAALFGFYFLRWYESIAYFMLLNASPYLVGIFLPTVHSIFWFDFFSNNLKAQKSRMQKNSTNQNALESIEFYIERMKFYRIFIDVPAIGAGLQGKEPVW